MIIKSKHTCYAFMTNGVIDLAADTSVYAPMGIHLCICVFLYSYFVKVTFKYVYHNTHPNKKVSIAGLIYRNINTSNSGWKCTLFQHDRSLRSLGLLKIGS